jgi:DNA-binding FadR family transcriptional regulator
MTAAIILQEVTFLELWEVMMLTEPSAAEAAATRAGDEEIAEVEQAQVNTRLALDDPESMVVWDIRFLDAIAQASHNRVLQLCRAPLGPLFYPTFLPLLERPVGGKRLVQAQAEIVDALKARDAGRAFDWMRRHIEDFRRGYEAAGMDVGEPLARQLARYDGRPAADDQKPRNAKRAPAPIRHIRTEKIDIGRHGLPGSDMITSKSRGSL